ncbi:pH-response regulator protein palH/rim-21 [Lasiosphaeria ovina]|uniref:PH-response regulator protein palH/rim-21 n=1 Tax=Lasiosphaeria ovina TaxID=92902 RepID=A0AAE0TSM9_9PEZI|nr:pH-response regulator protein palH/rim-21 [Lasiosphaeria ovina]
MEPRQLFRDSPAATATSAIIAGRAGCSSINLPLGGVLTLFNGDTITLTNDAVFMPACRLASGSPAIFGSGGGTLTLADTGTASDLASPPGDVQSDFSDFQEPFYASTFPVCYALAATTVVAYTLVIMLFITPRSFFDGGVVVLGRKSFTSGGTGTSIGGRPWLQKVAALTVAISLTIASAATFRVAETQYSNGYQRAETLQQEVLGGTELKVIRIISNTFLWLAQAQTLIRLFPRQREKVIIMWTAFALITLDVIFQSLDSFQYTQGSNRLSSFTDAVPALSYLFALALGVLYAAWVIYYALMKKRYAFYHPQMKNMCLVAMLSLLAIFVPIVFFILDISQPSFTGWGEYVRWVGAAAASVIVWEWVERIEALEREEKKDGILGREVFDGDEMLEMPPPDMNQPRRMKRGSGDDPKSNSRGRHDGPGSGLGNIWPAVTSITSRYSGRSRLKAGATNNPEETTTAQPSNHDRIRFLQPPLWPARPAPAVTPISRTDTASAESTVYAIRYHPLTETTSRTTSPPPQDNLPRSRRGSIASSHNSDGESTSPGPELSVKTTQSARSPQQAAPAGRRWPSLAWGISKPRTRRGDEECATPDQSPPKEDDSGWDFRSRLEEFAVTQAEKLRERFRPTPDTHSLPVMVIPAPPRRGAALAQLLEERESELQPHGVPRTAPPGDDELHLHRRSSGVPPSSNLHIAPLVTQGSLSGRHRVITIVPAPPRRDAESEIVASRPLDVGES